MYVWSHGTTPVPVPTVCIKRVNRCEFKLVFKTDRRTEILWWSIFTIRKCRFELIISKVLYFKSFLMVYELMFSSNYSFSTWSTKCFTIFIIKMDDCNVDLHMRMKRITGKLGRKKGWNFSRYDKCVWNYNLMRGEVFNAWRDSMDNYNWVKRKNN